MNAKPECSKTAAVVGLGATGLSCVRHLVAQGYRVRVTDSRSEPPMAAALAREFPALERQVGFRPEAFADAALLVVSPGVAVSEPAIRAAARRGAEIVGDIELFARAYTGRVLAITGSNGKSTVTALAGEMLRAGRLETAVGGNIGVPVLDLLRERGEAPWFVLELSSFQLETTSSLNAHAAVLLNISEDHMDRYASLADYAAAKARVFRGRGLCVANRDDPCAFALVPAGRETIGFGLDAPAREGDYGLLEEAGAVWLARGSRRIVPVSELKLAGRHNWANVLACLALARAAGVDDDAAAQAARAFGGLPHRAEFVGSCAGVRYINDSKGTNVGATAAALAGMEAPVVLIAGGDGKGQDFAPLREIVARTTRAVVLIGRDAPLLEKALSGATPLLRAGDMPEAVRRARAAARPGDVVLLSPACASFDMFTGYAQRGEAFRTAVKEICS
jgi:UDP-N-acetylmuramoylalanine--D-glutamate ligase